MPVQIDDDVIAPIDENGYITAGDIGDTHVVISYDNAVVPVPVLRPIGASDPATPAPESSKPIDRLVKQKLDKLGIVASEICTDEDLFAAFHSISRVSFPPAKPFVNFWATVRPTSVHV